MGKISKNKRKENFSILTKYEAFFTGGEVQFTSNGQLMLCTCGNELKVIDVSDGKIKDSIGGEENEEITSFVLAYDDDTLVIAFKNGLLKQWSLKEKMLNRTWKSFHIGKVSCMTFDFSITLLATGGSDSVVKIWDIHKKYCTHNLKGAQGVFSVVHFRTVNSKLCVYGAADDCKIHVWDLDSSQHVSSFEGHCSTVTGILFIEEKQQIISSSRDKVIIIWDGESGKSLKVIPVFESIESLILAPETLLQSLLSEYNSDDIYLITAGETGILKVWECSTAKCVFSQKDSITCLPEDSDYSGSVIIGANYIQALDVIFIITFEQNIILYESNDLQLKKQFVGYNDDILNMKLMGKKDDFLAVATNSPHIKIFELATFSCNLLKGHTDIVVSLDVFPNDLYTLLSGSKDNSVRIWKLDPETKTAKCLFYGEGHTHSINSVACYRGKLEFLSGSEDTTLKLWKIPHKIPVVALKMRLSAENTIKAHDKNINSIDISLNDKFVATGSQDRTAKIWDATDLSLVGIMRGHRKGVWCVAFSSVDLVLATSSGDGTVKIWSLSDFTTLKTFEGHEASVLQVIFLTRGTQLITSDSSGLLKLWDIKENQCVKTFDGHQDKIWTICSSNDETYIVSGGADSNIILWKDVTKEEAEKAIVEQEQFILRKQELSNFIHKKKWKKALQLSIKLEHPFHALTVINEMLLEEDGQSILKETVSQLTLDQIDVLLKFVVEWNTNSKNSHIAQWILKYILSLYTAEELLKNSSNVAAVESLLPYTERHLQRIDKLLQDTSAILKFMCQNMRVAVDDSQ